MCAARNGGIYSWRCWRWSLSSSSSSSVSVAVAAAAVSVLAVSASRICSAAAAKTTKILYTMTSRFHGDHHDVHLRNARAFFVVKKLFFNSRFLCVANLMVAETINFQSRVSDFTQYACTSILCR